MEWLTPLGLPVVQPYHKSSSKVVSTHKMCEIVCWYNNFYYEVFMYVHVVDER